MASFKSFKSSTEQQSLQNALFACTLQAYLASTMVGSVLLAFLAVSSMAYTARCAPATDHTEFWVEPVAVFLPWYLPTPTCFCSKFQESGCTGWKAFSFFIHARTFSFLATSKRESKLKNVAERLQRENAKYLGRDILHLISAWAKQWRQMLGTSPDSMDLPFVCWLVGAALLAAVIYDITQFLYTGFALQSHQGGKELKQSVFISL